MTALATNHPMMAKTPDRVPSVQSQARVTVGYIRLTSEESIKGLSASAQRENILGYAEHAGLGPVTIYEEKKAVGGDVPFEAREAGSRLLRDIKDGAISHIVVRDLDRLTRDLALWLKLEEQCVESDVTIHTLSGALADKAPGDRLGTRVRAVVAQFEKEQVGDRVRRVKRAMAQAGRPVGGPPPFGYTSQARVAAELRAGGMPADTARAEAEAVPLVEGRNDNSGVFAPDLASGE